MGSAQQAETDEAGTHLIADFWGVEPIDTVEALERIVRDAVSVANATLLDLRFHQFPGHGGITGYAMLAESHISVHTWPERDYVAIDVFMCGEHRPRDSLDVLRRAFRPRSEDVRAIRRGVGGTAASAPGSSATTPFERDPADAVTPAGPAKPSGLALPGEAAVPAAGLAVGGVR